MHVWLFSLRINPRSRIIGSEGKNIFKAADTCCWMSSSRLRERQYPLTRSWLAALRSITWQVLLFESLMCHFETFVTKYFPLPLCWLLLRHLEVFGHIRLSFSHSQDFVGKMSLKNWNVVSLFILDSCCSSPGLGNGWFRFCCQGKRVCSR